MKDQLAKPLGNPTLHPEPEVDRDKWGTTKEDIEGMAAMKAMMSQMK